MTATASAPGGRRAIRVSTVAHKLDGAVSTVWLRARNDPTFPRPFKLGPKVTVWWEHEIDAWLEQRAASREERRS